MKPLGGIFPIGPLTCPERGCPWEHVPLTPIFSQQATLHQTVLFIVQQNLDAGMALVHHLAKQHPIGPVDDPARDAAAERIALAKDALVRTGYFTVDEVSDDVAPRIGELNSARLDQIGVLRAEIAKLQRKAARCTQCGKDFEDRPCGPTHALIASERAEQS